MPRPLGGYLTRQISFLLNNYTFKEDGEDPKNPGLLIPRYMAAGRTAPDGKVYSEVSRMNDDDLVLVRSIVTKEDGNLTEVTPDLLSKKFLKTSIPDGSSFGLSAGTSFTESTTQGVLGLKHGGHERVWMSDTALRAPKDCELIEDGKWIYLKVRGKELKYPRPDNWINMGKTKYSEGEIVGSAYNTASPIIKLNSVLKLMQAKGGNGVKYFEKDQITISDCYAYNEGRIKYIENKKGQIEVWIGDTRYSYNPDAMYYFPDGTEIKKYQRICSGVVNMRQVASDLGGDINGIYNIFRKQYYTLTDPGYLKNGYVDPGAMQEEIVELVFRGLIDIVRDKGTDKIEEINYQGTQTSILNRKSFFTTISYGWSGKAVQKALKGELNLEGDTMTSTVLNLLLNDKLDRK